MNVGARWVGGCLVGLVAVFGSLGSGASYLCRIVVGLVVRRVRASLFC